MKQFVAIVSTTGSTVDKVMDFDTQSEADTHVAEHGGFVVSDPGGSVAFWAADDSKKTITVNTAGAARKAAMDEIERLETIPRRIRENLISLGTEDQVVIDEDAAIAVEREKL